MSYNVTINNKKYELPARTLSVDEQIEIISNLDNQFQKGEITRREVVTKMHEFVQILAPDALPDVDEVDVNDLFKTCIDIIEVYDAPAKKAKRDAALSDARDVLNRPEIKNALDLLRYKK